MTLLGSHSVGGRSALAWTWLMTQETFYGGLRPWAERAMCRSHRGRLGGFCGVRLTALTFLRAVFSPTRWAEWTGFSEFSEDCFSQGTGACSPVTGDNWFVLAQHWLLLLRRRHRLVVALDWKAQVLKPPLQCAHCHRNNAGQISWAPAPGRRADSLEVVRVSASLVTEERKQNREAVHLGK